MAKDINVNQPALTPEMEMIVRSLAALMQQNNVAPNNSKNDAVMDNINQFIVATNEERQKIKAKELEEKRISEESRKQNAMALKVQRDGELNKQQVCPHKKPSGATNVIGQKGQFLHTHYFCQECSKYWKDNELPFYLRPADQFIGGPI